MKQELIKQKQKLSEILKEYENVLTAKFGLESQKAEMVYEKQKRENDIRREVLYEVDENEKAKYSNEAKRNLEVSKRLETNDNFQKVNSAIRRLESEVTKLEINVNILGKKIQIEKKNADLLICYNEVENGINN